MSKTGANLFNHISQVGFVVRDLEKTRETMLRVFEREPDKVLHLPTDGIKYYGSDGDFTAVIAFYFFGDTQLEFIQPLSGKSIWQDFLDQGKEGLHHIRFSVESFSGARDFMDGKGVPISQEGFSALVPGLRWAYFDSEEPLGFIFEMFNEHEKKV